MFRISPKIRFDRNEFAGAFGDIGTDFPLIVGMILASGLDATSALVMFGLMQVTTGLIYGMPMPVQPLKAMAALVIAKKIGGPILYGAGLSIGLIMLLLTVTKSVDWLARVIPKCVVRGIQFGLGLQLSTIALKDYVARDGALGYGLAFLAFVTILSLWNNRKIPASLIVIGLGIAYALLFKIRDVSWVSAVSLRLPIFHIPSSADIVTGFFILALPQIPLSLGNSLLATKQISSDLFPDKPISIRKIGFTYSLMNLVNPFFSGIPTCHGAGGMAGHYAFGGRTGGSVIIYGTLYLLLGLFLSNGFKTVLNIFPMPVLGVILLFEGLALMVFARDLTNSKKEFTIALLVGVLAAGLPYGFLIGLIVGTLLVYFPKIFLKNC